MLATTFQLWPADVEKLIKNPQDLAFLHSMKEDRVASFGVFDRTLAQKIYRRNSREAAEAERLERARNDMKASSSSTVSSELVKFAKEDSDDSDESLIGNNNEDSDVEVRSGDRAGPRKTKLLGAAVVIPSDLLSRPNIVSLATRLKMTPMQQAAFTQGVIGESCGDLSMVAASYATADRSRRKWLGI